MPDLLKAIILGLVEGVTEFIPVSSTGHLIIASDWLDFTGDRAKTFEVFIQLGAILAIVWLYRTVFIGLLLGWHREGGARRLLINLIIAFLPAAIVGILFHGWIKEHLFNPFTVALALVVGGIVMLLIERWHPAERVRTAEELPPSTALGVGLAQVLSLFPGVSRSGATIMGGYALGLSRKAATEFSFFLAVPVMIAATLFDLVKSRDILSTADVPLFAVGFIVAFVSALFVVRAFLGYVSHRSFAAFAWYRIAFGGLLLAFYTLAR
ncbi:MAG: undecaprenyl-diphosphate phosphatase [Gemmatimonadota bacterium]